MRRAVVLVSALVAVVVIIGSGVYIASVALTPFSSVAVPASCTDAVSHLPGRRAYQVPRVRTTGTLLTSSPTSAVVLLANYGHRPFTSTVYVVDRRRHEVVRSLDFSNDVIAAAIDHGVLYLYHEGILYPISATTGRTLHGMVRFDNYRALYVSRGQRRMQTSAAISSLGFDGHLVAAVNNHFATVAYGCYHR